MMKTLKELFQLSDDATQNLKSGIIAVTITNLVTLLSVVVVVNLFTQLINPLEGKEISFSFMWIMLGVGIVLAVLLFFASKNDYRKTYVSCYTAAKDSRIKIAETVRKFPMSVFNSKSLAEI
ncbi:MAG: ABC transporter ATP-binding protein, partial [Butyrivibrio sp.]|nr:ABC transporter ATP-binding protein [Butyrivibrio sp.]